MKENIKKYWFVGVIGIILIAGVTYFAYEKSKEVIPGKTKDGESVIYSLKDTDVLASEFYNSLYKTMGVSSIAQRFQFLVIDQMIETTEEMKTNAKTQADAVKQQYIAAYQTNYEDALLQTLKSIGYNNVADLETHLIITQKYDKLITDSTTELFDAFSAENNPRVLSHILIKMADPANPTAEETAKLEEVKKAIADGLSFEEAAVTYSDDPSGSEKGLLGYVDKNTKFVPEFLAAGIALEAGQTSEWVQTTYGMHLIRCDATDLATLSALEEFNTAIFNANPNYIPNKLFEEATKLGIEYGTPELENELKAMFGLGGQN